MAGTPQNVFSMLTLHQYEYSTVNSVPDLFKPPRIFNLILNAGNITIMCTIFEDNHIKTNICDQTTSIVVQYHRYTIHHRHLAYATVIIIKKNMNKKLMFNMNWHIPCQEVY